MGRGRAKAKQTRVARDLKYRSIDTDFASLERELRGESVEDEIDDDDPYASEDDDDLDAENDDQHFRSLRRYG